MKIRKISEASSVGLISLNQCKRNLKKAKLRLRQLQSQLDQVQNNCEEYMRLYAMSTLDRTKINYKYSVTLGIIHDLENKP